MRPRRSVTSPASWTGLRHGVEHIHAEGHDAIAQPLLDGSDVEVPVIASGGAPTIMPMIRFEQTDHHAYSAQLRRQGQAIGQYTIVVIQFPIANLAGHPAAVSNKIIVITNE